MRSFAVLLICLFLVVSLKAQLSPELQQVEQTLSAQTGRARVDALNRLGWGYRRIDARKSIRYSRSAIQLSRKARYWNGLAFSYKNLGAAYSISGNHAAAEEYLGKALQQFSELNNRAEAGNIHNLFGLMYWETGDYKRALASYDKAMDQYRRGGDREGIAIVYSNTGIIYYEMGQLGKSLERYSKCLEIAGKRQDFPTLASVHSNIGLIYATLENYPKALFHHKASVRYELKLGSYSGEAKSYTNIGVCYYSMNLPDSSLVYHQKALKLYETISEKKGIARSLMNIGSIYMDKGDYATADRNYARSLALERHISDLLGETILLNAIGRLRSAEQRYTEAIPYLEQAYMLAYQLHSLRYQTESSQQLAEIHERLGHAAEAMSYYKIYTVANDSLLRERSDNKLTALLISFATKGKQQEIHSLQRKNKTVNTQKTLIAITGSLVVAITGLVVLSLRKRHRREKLLLEAQLIANKATLMAYTKELIAQHTELSELRSEPGQEEPVADAHADTINQLTGARIVTDEDWDEFKKLFVRVYPKFMLRMKTLYPGITQAELRLAALINLQLSSREIAAMLGISSESVKKARQRLRKKLGLSPEQDLDQLIHSFAR
jgi:tetratricopeptide (TPR) repeat protein